MTNRNTGFTDLDDESFEALLDSAIDNPDVLELAMAEASSRYSSLEASEVRELLERWSELQLSELQQRFSDLLDFFPSQKAEIEASFKSIIEQGLARTYADQSADPKWPWPITEPTRGKGAGNDVNFEHEISGLRLCGYRVGKTNGMHEAERKRFLDHFFREQLPEVVVRHHGSDYGAPGSESRLKKMANVIASHCRNFKKNDREKFRVAIGDWEKDLDYLRAKYYKANSFPWPPVDPGG